MATCQRFEREFLGDFEERALGKQRDHVQQCPECRACADTYAKIIAALVLDHAPAPSQDWQARVITTVRAQQALRTTGTRVRGAKPARSARFFGAFAALAALAVLATRPWSETIINRDPAASEAELSEYVAVVEGGARKTRAQTGPSVFHPGAPIELVLRPTHAVASPVSARVFVMDAAAELQPLAADIVQLRQGVLRLKLRVPDATPVHAGHISLIALVAPTERLASATDLELSSAGFARRVLISLEVDTSEE